MTPTMLFLIATLLKATALFSAAALVAAALRGASAAARHALWTAALGATLVVSALAFVVPQWKVVSVPVAIALEPQAPQLNAAVSAMPTSNAQPPTIAAKKVVTPTPARNVPASLPVTAKESQPVSAAAVPQPTTAQTASAPLTLRPQAVLAGFWIIGALLVMGRYLVNALRLRRAQRLCRAITSGALAERLQTLQQHLGIARPITLVESDTIEVPMTWGVVYPRVLLPKAAAEWSAARIDSVLQHELAHVKRCDALTQWLAYFACAVYWFHPLAWYAARQMRAERERACDDFVLHAGVPASAYASDLLEIVSSFRTGANTELYPAALAMARRSQFEGRLMALLNPQAKRSAISRLQLIATLVFTLAVSIPLAALAARGGDYRVAMGLPVQSDEPATSVAPESGVKGGVVGGIRGGVEDGVPGGVEPGVAQGIPGGVQDGVPGGVTSASGAAPAAPVSGARPGFSYYNEYGSQPLAFAAMPQAARAAVPPDLLTGCTRGKDSSSSHRTESDGTSRRVKISWEGSDCTIDMRAEGKYTFNADFTAFETIGSFVEIKTDIRGDRTELNIRPGATGLQYQFFRNRQETPYAQGGAEFLAKFLMTADRLFAIGIDARFPKLVQEGGPNRVLAEVGVMGNDYARATYMLRLVETVPLNAEQLRSTLIIDQNLGSDYEKARVLVGVAKKYDLNDAGVREAFLGAANSMSSDYEHARSLLAFFDKGGAATPEQLSAILSSVTRMSSDYEKARVLMAISSRYDLSSPGLRDAFLAATKTLTSDYEHARSLLAFFEKGAATPAQADAVLTSVTRMSSDYERGRVLLKLNEGTKLDPSARLRFIAAADGMQSDYEKGRVLKSAIAIQDTDDAAALAIIQCTRRMSSDNERSGVLQKLARSRSLEGKLRDAFIDAARAMGSDYERNKALAAIGMGPDTARNTL